MLTNEIDSNEDAKIPFLTDTEQGRLDKSLNKLEELLDAVFEDGPPIKGSDVRVAKEIATELSNTTLKIAEVRNKAKQTDTDEKLTEAIRESIRDMHREKAKKISTLQLSRERELEDTFIPNDIVPGETVIEIEELSPEEFLKQNNEEE